MTTKRESETGTPANELAESSPAQTILDKALELAELRSWESVRLYDIATALGITLDQVRQHYRQKDDLAEAWFDRADSAMLTDAARPDYLQLSGRERIHRSIMAWLNALSSHRRITRDMLMYKLEFGHIHLQALGIMRISRTVQWILESAHSKTSYVSRVLEEVGVTSIYLATFAYWLQDESVGSAKTSQFLDRMLRRAEWISGFLNPTSIASN
jgi:ubiquinone biosynthesis protein COQ9